MAAAATDKFRKKKNLFSTTLSGSITDSDTSLSCASLSGVPTDTGVTITVDRVSVSGTSTPSLREDITGVVSGNSLTNLVRGEGATTAQAHENGAVVEITWETETWNDAVDAILVAHNQDGTHKSGSVLTLPQINDTSSDHQYVFAVNELAADRTVTLPLLTGADEFVFKDHAVSLANKTLTSPVLNGDITGTGVLDEDTMSTNSSTKLATQQSIKAYVDSKVNTDGWVAVSDTWTYASASTFTIASVDRTSIYTPGTKLKFTQTSAKYAVVVSSSFSTNTTVTIAVNTDYVIANAAITAPYYSYQQSPVGFPNFFTYAPTHTGFSAAPTGTFKYSLTKGLCWIMHGGDTPGASNGTAFTVTGPVVASGVSYGIGAVYDNGSWQSTPGRLATTNGSAAITVSKDAGGSTFTGSGNKTALFQFTYTW